MIECEHWTGNANWSLKPLRVRNTYNWIKPTGALWVSPVISNYGWRHWADQNEYGYGPHRVRLWVRTADCLVIDAENDLERMIWRENDAFDLPMIDFEAMQRQGIASIWLTEAGLWAAAFPLNHNRRNLYSWDCECLLILDERVILSWEFEPAPQVAGGQHE